MSFSRVMFLFAITAGVIVGVRHFEKTNTQRESVGEDTTAFQEASLETSKNLMPVVNKKTIYKLTTHSSTTSASSEPKLRDIKRVLIKSKFSEFENQNVQKERAGEVQKPEIKLHSSTISAGVKLAMVSFQQARQAILNNLNLNDSQMATLHQMQMAQTQAFKELMQSQYNPGAGMQILAQTYDSEMAQIMSEQQYSQYRTLMAQETQKLVTTIKGSSLRSPTSDDPSVPHLSN